MSTKRKARRRPGALLRTLVFTLVVGVGLGIIAYPPAMRWQAARAQAHASADFRQRADAFAAANGIVQINNQPKTSELLIRALEYNTNLNQEGAYFDAERASRDTDYLSQLKITGTQIIANVTVPKIDVNIPVYHGTSDSVFNHGAGHVYGSSLPVGGAGTHSVISAHSGMGNADYFTRLDELTEGDEFYVIAAGQSMRYEVDQITVVMPADISNVKVVPGEDYVTLVTCTPPGLNTMRLLVRGVRADLPATEMASIIPPIPFPWWLVLSLGGIAVAIALAYFTTPTNRALAAGAGGGNWVVEADTPLDGSSFETADLSSTETTNIAPRAPKHLRIPQAESGM